MRNQIIRQAFLEVREQNATVHCITNMVTVNDCANMLLAAGAHPTMAHAIQEVGEITSGCNSLVLNLGATESYEAMKEAARTAKEKGIPIVLDPVGCGGSAYRREMVSSLLKIGGIRCIRGNASEIEALWKNTKTTVGVDAGLENQENIQRKKQSSIELAKKCKGIVVMSGETDIITDGKTTYFCQNGDPMMTQITGSGCMETAVIGAYLAAEKQRNLELEYVMAAIGVMGICGEQAALQCRKIKAGTMTFRQYFIDEMSQMDLKTIEQSIRIQNGE